jgi:hypothetical protein
MVDAKAGALAGLILNVLSVLALTIAVAAYSSQLGKNFYGVLGACIALMLCVYPPSVATYLNLNGNTYTYENYILQVFLPMCIGFLVFICISFFNVLQDFDDYHEQLIIYLGSASILSSALAFTYMLYRMNYHGT